MSVLDAFGATLYLVIFLSSILIPIVLIVWLLLTVSAIRRSQEDIARSLRMMVEEMQLHRLKDPQARS
jgi:uncharacterized paraquat-inducible protein A